ncbi:hypothetical protein Belba_3297 [Belliella baltica DSM 15883]|uniref:BNR/Asp-box repeat protein n=1 Tax=Belliella baltica (strain DSM 15883 / CIP 108006 / LMG 21964 / BA134) TaxID=866536 RepID=I3Z987_BELBD|nr:sialidase family protein [Belliella baltica]AFL85805.1 hypothetical protein Belba_3297 [Belliella baltica DSM 15883]
MKNSILFLPFLFLIFSISCQSETSDPFQEEEKEKGLRIIWDQTSLRRISSEGYYPRMRVLKDKSLLLVYENFNGDIKVKRSTDGIQWEDLGVAFRSFLFNHPENGNSVLVRATNPEIIQLENGDILLATNLRPTADGIYPFSIAIKRSLDNGVNWTNDDIVYKGGNRFDNGCWEPAFLALPNGDIQIYFANETPFPNNNDQEISIITSKDNGHTWTEDFLRASYREGHRDGMPVPVHDGENIYVSIEDNISGQFKPYIIKNSLQDNWQFPVNGNSLNRYNALADQLPNSVYAGAPYLIRTQTGLFILSYQTTENRSNNWELSTMEVVISETPSNFLNPTRPFNVPFSKEAKWNSITDLGNDEVAALSTTNFQSNQVEIWMIKGKIERN